ncbi:hypothetical protein EJF18_60288 [Clavispora lusitaniae]|uniref:Uncharacterized protein n=2 Tax=Clavispora lusitaniae TaxID=36911 RepID=C4YAC1_CLAL4|nr:uncharacterized protein CLUG_05059 [Clavispora lusitaniae ATCC 42720]KAF7580867.1 Cohesin loading factor family protein [Clavispora lusitaniae]EEQ40931.1 hypothetical protein CLUG_05059 [Clavispora lusitaniae ATCC 42720]QFZ29775.1 hypothetical protein EJF14_60288 [Clavispora lusitaniae]QFZ35425.1 hypothetical protein EJF16_60288 [Clavispora lusitaniae]QFZ41119.1 hypothetical protein EJF15_60288 [Clavispora lusitaniae]
MAYSDRKNNPMKRVLASSRREVQLDGIPKKKRPATAPEVSPGSSDSRSSQVSILTSRPNSGQKQSVVSPAVSSAFYARPKSGLEQQYERNLQRFLPVEENATFKPLSSEGEGENPGLKKEEDADRDGVEGSESKESESVDCPNTESEPDQTNGDVEVSLSQIADPESAEHSDFCVGMSLKVADFFLEAAHASVLEANDLPGAKSYFSHIKTAIKALLFLLAQPSLDPALESVVCIRLAHIFFSESENLESADKYVLRGISLAVRHNLDHIRASGELLYAQILQKSNPRLVNSFLLDKISFYGNSPVADLFALVRADNLLVTEVQTAASALRALSVSENTTPLIRALALLSQVSLCLYRGSPGECGSLLKSFRSVTENVDCPSQMKGMALLLELASMGQCKDGDVKQRVQSVSKFVSTERKSDWKGWTDDGSFEFHIPIANGTIPYTVQWINSDEFTVMFYFLSGVLFLDSGSYKKASKVFSACLDSVDDQLQELTQAKPSKRAFCMSLLTEKIVRLNFVRISVYCYKVWLNFMQKNDFSGIEFLQNFIRDFDHDNFTTEELCYYKLLLPRMLYLAALYYQTHGDLTAAKYYFLRVKNLTSSHGDSSVETSLLQKNLGIGCETLVSLDSANEYNVCSTIHLLLISEYEMRLLSQEKTSEKSHAKAARIRSFLGSLHSDLSTAMTSSSTFATSNPLYLLTYKSVLCIYQNKGFPVGDSTRNTELVKDIKELVAKSPQSGYLATLIAYVTFRLSTDITERKRLFAECYEGTAGKDDNSRILRLLLAQEERKSKSELGDRDRIGRIDTKIEKLNHTIDAKFKLAQWGNSESSKDGDKEGTEIHGV